MCNASLHHDVVQYMLGASWSNGSPAYSPCNVAHAPRTRADVRHSAENIISGIDFSFEPRHPTYLIPTCYSATGTGGATPAALVAMLESGPAGRDRVLALFKPISAFLRRYRSTMDLLVDGAVPVITALDSQALEVCPNFLHVQLLLWLAARCLNEWRMCCVQQKVVCFLIYWSIDACRLLLDGID